MLAGRQPPMLLLADDDGAVEFPKLAGKGIQIGVEHGGRNLAGEGVEAEVEESERGAEDDAGKGPEKRLLLTSSSKRRRSPRASPGSVGAKRLELRWRREGRRGGLSGIAPAISPWLRSTPATVVMRFVGCRSAVDAGVVADGGTTPIAGEVLGVVRDGVFPGLEGDV
ncbi:hypothetical protein HPP92_018041 [Vanilla planifolia]|uniref:Uncharacterized protein n=1 Tax=Vanilla planifolia TaxID=51239 RepID=A0A835UP52_VANPL|nr:hypothetical protein HPP92_018041 [Vanilla planifolia]